MFPLRVDPRAELISQRKDVRFFVLDCRGINGVDSTGLTALESVHKELKSQNIGFRLANVKGVFPASILLLAL